VTQPVTVIVERRVKPGSEAEYEALVDDVIHHLQGFAGYLGLDLIRPAQSGEDYVVIFRFDSYPQLRAWEDSPTRHRWLEQIERLCVDEKIIHLTGLEFLFARANQRPPVRWKQVLLTWIVLFPLSHVVAPLLNAALPGLPPLGHTMVNTLLLLALMTYLIMPPVTRLAARWLYR
jgi:hypothetical protein